MHDDPFRQPHPDQDAEHADDSVRLTAFALGELEDDERKAIERTLSADQSSRNTRANDDVASIQRVASALDHALHDDASTTLTPLQRERIVQRAHTRAHSRSHNQAHALDDVGRGEAARPVNLRRVAFIALAASIGLLVVLPVMLPPSPELANRADSFAMSEVAPPPTSPHMRDDFARSANERAAKLFLDTELDQAGDTSADEAQRDTAQTNQLEIESLRRNAMNAPSGGVARSGASEMRGGQSDAGDSEARSAEGDMHIVRNQSGGGGFAGGGGDGGRADDRVDGPENDAINPSRQRAQGQQERGRTQSVTSVDDNADDTLPSETNLPANARPQLEPEPLERSEGAAQRTYSLEDIAELLANGKLPAPERVDPFDILNRYGPYFGDERFQPVTLAAEVCVRIATKRFSEGEQYSQVLMEFRADTLDVPVNENPADAGKDAPTPSPLPAVEVAVTLSSAKADTPERGGEAYARIRPAPGLPGHEAGFGPTIRIPLDALATQQRIAMLITIKHGPDARPAALQLRPSVVDAPDGPRHDLKALVEPQHITLEQNPPDDVLRRAQRASMLAGLLTNRIADVTAFATQAPADATVTRPEAISPSEKTPRLETLVRRTLEIITQQRARGAEDDH